MTAARWAMSLWRQLCQAFSAAAMRASIAFSSCRGYSAMRSSVAGLMEMLTSFILGLVLRFESGRQSVLFHAALPFYVAQHAQGQKYAIKCRGEIQSLQIINVDGHHIHDDPDEPVLQLLAGQ